MRSTLLGPGLEKATYTIKRRGKVYHTLVAMHAKDGL